MYVDVENELNQKNGLNKHGGIKEIADSRYRCDTHNKNSYL